MSAEINTIISDTEASMQKALNHLEAELVKIRAGKANPTMLDGIVADYYGNPTAINQIANISVLDARTISVHPWEKICCKPLKEQLPWLILVLIRKMTET